MIFQGILRDLEATIDFIALSPSNAVGKGGGASTNYTTFIALYSVIAGYFLFCNVVRKKMQFAGLNNVFITAILDTGWEV